MKTGKFDIGHLQCLYAINPDSSRIAYILYPMDVLRDWVSGAADKYGVSIAVITGMDWDDDLTPWPAPGQPPGSPDFKGLAPQFLKSLTDEVIPAVEHRFALGSETERSLVGVSLSGLFTLWQWPQATMFHNIATLSGSFWYEGFEQWVLAQSFAGKTGNCYMLLGSDEPNSPVAAFRKVGEATAAIVEHLRNQGVKIEYDIVPGNHFQFGLERLDKAFTHLFLPQKSSQRSGNTILSRRCAE